MSRSPGERTSAPGAVALIGFMAAGKSAVGRAAAGRLGVPFVDTDALIEKRAGNIRAIFEASGEAAFRRLERDVAVEVLSGAVSEACVVALGGGAVLSVEVRRALRSLPHVVWLTAPLDVLWERAGGESGAERPLAQDEAAFARLLADRSRLYAEVASVEILNDGLRPLGTVVDAVVELAGGETPRRRAASGGTEGQR